MLGVKQVLFYIPKLMQNAKAGSLGQWDIEVRRPHKNTRARAYTHPHTQANTHPHTHTQIMAHIRNHTHTQMNTYRYTHTDAHTQSQTALQNTHGITALDANENATNPQQQQK